MRRTAKNRDSDLGCLLQSAIIAVLLIALTAFSLNQLESLIQSEGTGTEIAHADEEHSDTETIVGDQATSGEEHTDEESSSDDDTTTAGDDQTDQETASDDDTTTADDDQTDQETTSDDDTTTAGEDQTDQETTSDDDTTTAGDDQTDQETASDDDTTTADDDQTDQETTSDDDTTTAGDDQTDQETASDDDTTTADDDQTDQEAASDDDTTSAGDDQADQETGSVETADSVVDTTDDEAKDPEDGVVTNSDTNGEEFVVSGAEYDPEVVAEGESLYVLCAACHGPDARGLPGLGLDLLVSEFVESLNDEELRDFVITGRPVWDLNNTTGIDMPPKGGNPILTGDDILKIIAYIRTLPTQAASGEETVSENPAPDMTEEDIVALGYDPEDVTKGESLYVLCSACHGPDMRGLPGLGLDLLNSEFVDSLSDEELRDFVVVGRPIWDPGNTTGVDMPAKGGNPILTGDDILKIIAYIRIVDITEADNDGSPPSSETSTNPAPASGVEIDLAAAGYDPEVVSQGESLYILCAACHGPDARGLPGLGLDLVTSQFVEENNDEALLAFVLIGRPVWDPTNTSGVDMPPKGGNPALTDEDTLKIIAYLRTLRANATP